MPVVSSSENLKAQKLTAAEDEARRFVTVDAFVTELQKHLNSSGLHHLYLLLANFRAELLTQKEFYFAIRVLIGAPVLMIVVQGLQAAQMTKIRLARAVRAACWARLRRFAPLVGRWALFVRQLHAETSFRPGGQGAKRCRQEFEALAAGAANLIVPNKLRNNGQHRADIA